MFQSQLSLAVVIGAGATLTLDLWNLALSKGLGVRSLDFCLLGRWVAHLPRGVVRHTDIAAAEPRPGECVVGWVTHYAIGAGLAMLFAVGRGVSWLRPPTLLAAVLFGIATVVFPFFVLQPALGLGIASSATRRPAQARLKSLMTHAVYGVGLYAWARVAAWWLAR